MSEGRALAPKQRPGLKPKLEARASRILAAGVEGRTFVTLSESGIT
ncbi:hypothetical protein [Rubrobacter xylanophilus]|nr:hypothetical protein [Rubrobacter xylanophilus]